MTRVPHALAVVSLVGAVLALQGCSDSCGSVGCGPVAVLRVDLPAATQAGAQVTACRLDACAAGVLPAPSATPQVGIAVPLAGTSAADVSAALWTRADATLVVEVSWLAAADPRDGDTYAVSVVDGRGSTVAGLSLVAAYASVFPNGDGCAPVCASAGAFGDPP
jgi:hypothetical protein